MTNFVLEKENEEGTCKTEAKYGNYHKDIKKRKQIFLKSARF